MTSNIPSAHEWEMPVFVSVGPSVQVFHLSSVCSFFWMRRDPYGYARPRQMTKDEAEQAGLRVCQRCIGMFS